MQITLVARRDDGYPSTCNFGNLGGSRARVLLFWTSVENFCDRPLPADPTGGVGKGGGRPLPSDPTGLGGMETPREAEAPPPQPLIAAPDLRLDKSADQETCLPNQKCKFTVEISNDGIGGFNPDSPYELPI